ncbi:MAG: ParB/RepB/Spo0J family partition protein [Oscillospiraceae bacterium]|nr:ParB/RepB/Spo0J family partition protein [Oscillospiraceae bacterium]
MGTKKNKPSFMDLLDDNDISGSEGLSTLRISDIEPNKDQPRKEFDKEALAQLADSINKHGVLQPLLVRSLPAGGYQIIAGERRWRAAKMAGLSEVPVVIRDDIRDEQIMQIALIENLQRENLNPIEEALGYKELMDSYKMTQDELSQVIGKARSSIANSLGLLNLPAGVKTLLVQGELSAGHCKALKAIKDEALMTELARRAASGELSVRQIEQIAKREAQRASEEEQSRKIKPRVTYFTEVEISLADKLGTKVKISEGKKSNTLEISFADEEQLKGILKHFIDE